MEEAYISKGNLGQDTLVSTTVISSAASFTS